MKISKELKSKRQTEERMTQMWCFYRLSRPSSNPILLGLQLRFSHYCGQPLNLRDKRTPGFHCRYLNKPDVRTLEPEIQRIAADSTGASCLYLDFNLNKRNLLQSYLNQTNLLLSWETCFSAHPKTVLHLYPVLFPLLITLYFLSTLNLSASIKGSRRPQITPTQSCYRNFITMERSHSKNKTCPTRPDPHVYFYWFQWSTLSNTIYIYKYMYM